MLEKKIAFCDNDLLSRQTTKNFLNKISNIEIIGEYDNTDILIDNLKKKTPNIVFINLNTNNLSEILSVKNILTKNPDVKVIVISRFEDFRTIAVAFSAGAIGFLSKKDVSVRDLSNAINHSLKNNHFLSRSCEKKMKDMSKLFQLNYPN